MHRLLTNAPTVRTHANSLKQVFKQVHLPFAFAANLPYGEGGARLQQIVDGLVCCGAGDGRRCAR